MTEETPPIIRRKRRLAAGAAVLGAGALLAGPITAFAQQDDDDSGTETETESGAHGGWVADALSELVTAGTLTQAQADAVAEALEAARPERPFGGGRHWRGGPGGLGFGRIGLDAAAEVIGIEEDELREALRDGSTLAELAEQNGVATQAVIDALVAEATERITTLVNEGFPEKPARPDEAPDSPDEPAPTTTTG
jgi:hypothetical protein